MPNLSASFKRGGIFWNSSGPNSKKLNYDILHYYPSLNQDDRFSNFTPRQSFEPNLCFPTLPFYNSRNVQLIKRNLKNVDLLLEVRDARFPIGTSIPELNENLPSNVQRAVILNKVDLVSQQYALVSKRLIEKESLPCMLISATSSSNIADLFTFTENLLVQRFKSLGTSIMIAGVPNVGKSSILNSLKIIGLAAHNHGIHNNNNREKIKYSRKVLTTPNPNSTKSIQKVLVGLKPKMYFIDTPGIIFPISENSERNIRLISLGCFLNSNINEISVADWILFYLNKQYNFNYVDILELEEPSNDIKFISSKISSTLKPNSPRLSVNDYTNGCRFFIDLFRSGKLGFVAFDHLDNFMYPPLNSINLLKEPPHHKDPCKPTS